MADLSSTIIVYQQDTVFSRESTSPLEWKEILVETPDTADANDYFEINLADYGMTYLKSIKRWEHTTNYSVIVAGTAATTTATTGSTGTARITLGAGISNKKYVFLLGGK